MPNHRGPVKLIFFLIFSEIVAFLEKLAHITLVG
jgi:hypothetical protein